MATTISFHHENNQYSERFSLIWLHLNLQDTPEIEQNLGSIFDDFIEFRDLEQCKERIQQTSSTDRLVLIIDSQLERQLIYSFHEIEQVISIYIYCIDTNTIEQQFSKYTKVRGVFHNIDELNSKIRYDHRIQKQIKEPLAVNIFSSDGKSTTQIDGHFVFFQVIINCLLRLKPNETDKNELISLFQNAYQGNKNELKNLEEFQQNYSSENAIWWYTRESFFYRTINAALRTENIHMMFLLRSFIFDIHQQLQNNQFNDTLKVYRNQIMSKYELERFKQSEGQLVSVNSFFSTSRDRLFTVFKLGESNATVNWERILFEITVDITLIKTKPFADISQLSRFPDESEILFMAGSIFRLNKIFQDENQLWIVQMTLSSDNEHDLKDILKDINKQIGKGETNLRTFGKILWEIGEFKLAEEYFLRLLNQLPSNDPLLLHLYDDLAKLTSQMKHLDESMQWYHKLLTFKEQNRLSLSIMSAVNSVRIQRNDLELFQEIGSGGFGRIYRARWLINDHIVAVKVLHSTHLNNETRQIFFNELSILNGVRHPNIVTFYGACLNEDWLALIMEYIPMGSLYQILHKEKLELSWPDRLAIALQAAKGLNHLHQQQPQILHRDIKSSNLLLENRHREYYVKICDFGMAKTRDETIEQTKGRFLEGCTLSWTAPEVLKLEPYTEQSDVYSLGIVYWELANCRIPYDGHQYCVIRESVIAGDRLKILTSTPLSFRDIIEQCWAQKPQDRPICVDLLRTLNECVEKQNQTNVHPFRLSTNLTWKQNAKTIAGGNDEGYKLNQLSKPNGIYVDYQQQSIYIADTDNHRIVKWKLGDKEGQIVAKESRYDCLIYPINVVIDKNYNSLIICDRENKQVIRWSLENPQDRQILIWNISCIGLMMHENGDLFVCDNEKNAVKRWRKNGEKGTIVAGGNRKGRNLNQLNNPTYIFIDREETVYVSDCENHRVMKWMKGAKEGIVVAGGHGQGKSLKQLSYPMGLVVTEVGDVYVADANNNRVMCWPLGSKEGRVIGGGNGFGEGSNQLWVPIGLSLDAENNLYVVDHNNHRIQQFEVDKY